MSYSASRPLSLLPYLVISTWKLKVPIFLDPNYLFLSCHWYRAGTISGPDVMNQRIMNKPYGNIDSRPAVIDATFL